MDSSKKQVKIITTCAFGVEASLKREITGLGMEISASGDGFCEVNGSWDDVVVLNLWLRCADRVLLKIAEFDARTFDELFDGVANFAWESLIPSDGRFTVVGKSVKSALTSVPACQSIVKKAVAKKLGAAYKTEWLAESGAEYRIQTALLKDRATLTVDTTGAALNKRGYRQIASEAPIKEVLAAAMIELSYWRKGRILLDPFCGSGTIAIEAAMAAKNIAPGLMRNFASEGWGVIPKEVWTKHRKQAYQAIDTDFTPQIFASDIDASLIKTARENARIAGVDDCINFSVTDVAGIELPGEYGVMITNPPYGHRIGDESAIRQMHNHLGRLFPKHSTWSAYIITADEGFEAAFGRRANAKRKLFNGNIKTDYYQYHGPRP